jgi:UDP-GlcNAc:undecaprenyl-phosphate/decaprenyl-phosphate GlcNAc-1-phosphate transferase
MNNYKTYAAIFVLATFCSFWLTPLAAWLAAKVGAIDLPGPRKVHARPMPRLGGVAVYLGFFLPWSALYLLHNKVSLEFQNYEKLFLTLALGSGAMLLLGIYDDIKGADPAKKFFIQVLIAIGLWAGGYRIAWLQNPFGDNIISLGWLQVPVTVLWLVGVTNAINLLDGIDGLVAGVTTCIGLSLAVISALQGSTVMALLTVALAGSCFGFLGHNYAPARIFLGDSGSLTIGVILGCIGVFSLFQGPTRAASPLLSVPLILFGLPIFDTVRVMLKRWRAGKPIFAADRNHIHHRLLALGLNHRQAAWVLYGVAIVTGGVAILLCSGNTDSQARLSIVFGLLAAGFYILWKVRVRPRLERMDAAPPPPPPQGVAPKSTNAGIP